MTIAICMLVTTLGGTWNNKKFLQIKKKEKFFFYIVLKWAVKMDERKTATRLESIQHQDFDYVNVF